MPAAAQPVNTATNALGMMYRRVRVEQVVPERGVAIVQDEQGFTSQIPYRVQAGRGRMPQEGDYWYVDRSMGPWVFSAHIAPDDTAFSTFADPVTAQSGLNVAGDVRASGSLVQPAYEANSFTRIQPLVTSTGVDAAVLTLPDVTFKNGYAYRISYHFRTQHNGGTSPYVANARVKRASASGTIIYDPGGTAAIGLNFMTIHGFFEAKNTTGSDHTQTLVLTAAMSVTGSPTSLDIESADNCPATLHVETLGLASQYPGAIEVPTA